MVFNQMIQTCKNTFGNTAFKKYENTVDILSWAFMGSFLSCVDNVLPIYNHILSVLHARTNFILLCNTFYIHQKYS